VLFRDKPTDDCLKFDEGYMARFVSSRKVEEKKERKSVKDKNRL
jgi:hypothetical protein